LFSQKSMMKSDIYYLNQLYIDTKRIWKKYIFKWVYQLLFNYYILETKINPSMCSKCNQRVCNSRGDIKIARPCLPIAKTPFFCIGVTSVAKQEKSTRWKREIANLHNGIISHKKIQVFEAENMKDLIVCFIWKFIS